MARTPRPRRQYPAEFKAEAVRVLRARMAEGSSLAQVGRELDVSEGVLRGWAQRVGTRDDAALSDVFPGQGNHAAESPEVRRLKRELEVMRQERDFLKKAVAFFAKESP